MYDSAPDDDDLVVRLAELEIVAASDQLGAAPEDLRTVRAELETLLEELRQPPSAHDFEQERGCDRAGRMARDVGSPGQLGAYELHEPIGFGGMGIVYRARHVRLNRVVAVKTLPIGSFADFHAAERFRREMEAVGKLDHPHLVRATDAGEDGGVHYLAMEFIDGLDLGAVLRRSGPLSSADACQLIRQACDGLHEAHQHGLIHRDLKPSNLMLARGPRGKPPLVKVLDLGLARLSEPSSTDRRELTESGQIMGTLDYMAPEQIDDSHGVDVRADVYSLGATLYALLCGETPFSRAGSTRLARLLAKTSGAAPSIGLARADLPGPLAKVIDCMLSRAPADRFATAREAGDALARFAAGADLAALLARAEANDATDRTLAKVVAAKNAVGRRSLAIPIVAALALLLGLALGAAVTLVLRTERGSMVIEFADDESIQVTIAGKTAIVSDRDSGQTWSLEPGEHDITIRHNDLEMTTDKLVVKRGDRAILRVALVDGEALVSRDGKPHFRRRLRDNENDDEASDDPDGARERQLAEWARSMGGTVSILAGGRSGWYGQDDSLPLGALRVEGVTVFDQPRVTDDDLSRFGDLPNLHVFSMSGTSIGDAGMARLGKLPVLRDVFLAKTNVEDRSMRLLSEYRTIRVVDIRDTRVTDAGLKWLAEGLWLTELRLDHSQITDEGLDALHNEKGLLQLSCENTMVSKAAVERLHKALPGCSIDSAFGHFGPSR